MKIVVFGANGKVGNLVVEELLRRGHTVIAFVYGKSNFTETDNLKIFSGDVHSREDVANVLEGADAAASTLGSWGTKTKDILSSGMAILSRQKLLRTANCTYNYLQPVSSIGR